MAVAQTGISTAFLQQNISIIIGGGVLAFAIGYGLAARDVMANFLGSFYSSAKVKIGDVISLDDIEGEVIALDKTSITIATVQGKRVIYPIRRLLTDRVTIIDTKRLTE
ncbi:MAG: mechanosensitive ion channel domain-containing protein [Bacteroidota bacterium]